MQPSLNIAAIREHRPACVHRAGLEFAAVLVPVIRRDDGDWLVFTARSPQLRFQPGDISFPGGKVEPGDADLVSCALREAEEEISLERRFVEIIGELDQVSVRSRYAVTPFAGLVSSEASLMAQTGEAAAVISIAVAQLLNAGTDLTYQTGVEGIIIWGATAHSERLLKRSVTMPIDLNVILTAVDRELAEAWSPVLLKPSLCQRTPGSILDVSCGALVSPANSFGYMDGGIDLVYSMHFGWHVQERLQEASRRSTTESFRSARPRSWQPTTLTSRI